MWACALLAALVCLAAAAPQAPCPADCRCLTEGGLYTARCTSLDFLSKQTHSKQLLQIEALQITNQSVTSGSKLYKLPNLRAIDLSYNQLSDIPNVSKLSALTRLSLKSNNIRTLNVRALPAKLKFLDLSRNDIKNIPEDLLTLNSLVYLNLAKNPLHCTCDSADIRDVLLQRSVRIDEPVICAAPEKYKRKSWLSIECSDNDSSLKKVDGIYDMMMGDQPILEGDGLSPDSGSGEDLGAHFEDEGFPTDNSVEAEYIPLVNISSVTHAPLERIEEGSGDDDEFYTEDPTKDNSDTVTDYNVDSVTEEQTESSGDGEGFTPIDEDEQTSPTPGILLPECLFHPCPSPSPADDIESTLENSTGTDDLASIGDGLKVIYEDIVGTTETKLSKQIPRENIEEAATAAPDAKTPDNVEVISEPVDKTDLEQMQVEEEADTKQSTSTYILLFMLMVIVVALLIYAVLTRREAKRKYRRQSQNANDVEKPSNADVEMKLLSGETGNNDNKPQNGITEATPLVNGNNENQNEKQQPADEPDYRRNGNTNGKVESPYADPADSDGESEPRVDLRKKPDQTGLLTPEAQRVTIKVSELPDSLPKTPILVNRQISTDGRTFETIPSFDQRFK